MALEAAPSASEATVSALMATAVTKDDDEPMVTILPQEVIDALAELDLELSEGDITQKGYDKKRTKLLAPYIRKTKIEQITLNSSANTSSISVASSSLMSTAALASEVAASSTSSPPNGNGNNRIDLKTPSFIPVESSTIEASATNNEDIEPDSLDPNINNGDDLVIVGA